MSTEATAHKITRPNLVAVGTIVWLSSELMFFAGLFAIYFTTRAVQGPAIWLDSSELLNIPFAAFNTTILVLSSVTCQFGVFAAERFQNKRTGSFLQMSKWGMREWFALTFLMGAFFIAGQVYEYALLVSEGMTLSSTAYGSIFYIATGFHGLHVLTGVIYLCCEYRFALNGRYDNGDYNRLEILGLFWHFVDLVWILVFTFIYLL